MISLAARMRLSSPQWSLAQAQLAGDLRCGMPATVLSFDPGSPGGRGPTVVVRPALLERILVTGVLTDVQLPDLEDVPVKFPRGGGFSLTFPIAAGDECWLSFSDLCLDTWWEAGAADGPQPTPKDFNFRHAIGDAVAEVGLASSPRALADWSTMSCQLRSDDGTVVIDVSAAGVTITAPAVTISAPSIALDTGGGGPPAQGLVQGAFYTWFTTVFMPSVHYLTVAPPLPIPTPVSNVEAQ